MAQPAQKRWKTKRSRWDRLRPDQYCSMAAARSRAAKYCLEAWPFVFFSLAPPAVATESKYNSRVASRGTRSTQGVSRSCFSFVLRVERKPKRRPTRPYLFADERVLFGDGVLEPADVVLEDLAPVAAERARPRPAAALLGVAQRKRRQTQRRHGEFGARLRQVAA